MIMRGIMMRRFHMARKMRTWRSDSTTETSWALTDLSGEPSSSGVGAGSLKFTTAPLRISTNVHVVSIQNQVCMHLVKVSRC